MKKKKILMIDDDQEFCQEIAEILMDEGFEVHSVHTGQQGLKALALHRHDLVLLDIRLPDLSGFEILKKLSSEDKIPSILVTSGNPLFSDLAYLDPEKQYQEALIKQTQGFLNKPFDPEELLKKIHAIFS